MLHYRWSIALILLFVLSACGGAGQGAAPSPSATALPAGPTALPSPTIVPTSVPGVLFVDPAKDLGPISPYVYGANYSAYGAVPPDMLPAAYGAHITALRGLGGGWGENNDLQTYLIDAFVALCKNMGAIPTLSVRFKGGTPEQAAGWVRYANIEKGYNIEYWSIGNEDDYELNDGKPFFTSEFDQGWRAIAEAMKAVDPKIKLMVPELHQWGTSDKLTPKDPNGHDWMTDFLKANGDLVDIVTVHRYPMVFHSTQAYSVDELRRNTQEWGDMVVYLRDLIHQTTGRDIPIAFTEVNSDPSAVLGGQATPDSFYNAVWYADVLGKLIQQNVFMVNYWVLAYRSGGLGLIYNSQLRPAYYIFELYSHFGSEQVYAASGLTYVDVFAARRADGALTVMVVNLSDVARKVPLQVAGRSLGQAEVWRFDASHNAESLGSQSLPADGVLDLPRQSVTLYILQK